MEENTIESLPKDIQEVKNPVWTKVMINMLLIYIIAEVAFTRMILHTNVDLLTIIFGIYLVWYCSKIMQDKLIMVKFDKVFYIIIIIIFYLNGIISLFLGNNWLVNLFK